MYVCMYVLTDGDERAVVERRDEHEHEHGHVEVIRPIVLVRERRLIFPTTPHVCMYVCIVLYV